MPGWDMAGLDAIGRRRGTPVARLFVAEPRREIAVNATIGAYAPEATVAAARAARRAGYKTLKLKVGVESDLTADVRRIAAVREAVGTTSGCGLTPTGPGASTRRSVRSRPSRRSTSSTSSSPSRPTTSTAWPAVRRDASVAIAADEAVTGLEAADAS